MPSFQATNNINDFINHQTRIHPETTDNTETTDDPRIPDVFTEERHHLGDSMDSPKPGRQSEEGTEKSEGRGIRVPCGMDI